MPSKYKQAYQQVLRVAGFEKTSSLANVMLDAGIGTMGGFEGYDQEQNAGGVIGGASGALSGYHLGDFLSTQARRAADPKIPIRHPASVVGGILASLATATAATRGGASVGSNIQQRFQGEQRE